MITPKVGVRDYYELDPPLEHAPGDIWSDLPTFGVLPADRTAGLVITPACDLSNRKVETITYLPVITVRQFGCSSTGLAATQMVCSDATSKVGTTSSRSVRDSDARSCPPNNMSTDSVTVPLLCSLNCD